MARQTPNQNQWLNEAYKIKLRLRKLAQQGEDVSSVVIPDKPDTVTRKSLSAFQTINKELDEIEARRKKKILDEHTEQQRKISHEYESAKARTHQGNRMGGYTGHGGSGHAGGHGGGNPKGNPANLVHKGNPKGNPANLVHKGNIANLNRKGRIKGSKNKHKYTRTIKPKSNAPQYQHPEMQTGWAFIGDLEMQTLWERVNEARGGIQNNTPSGNALAYFIGSLLERFGEGGTLDILRKAMDRGVFITDRHIYGSDTNEVSNLITDISEVLDSDEEYEEYQEIIQETFDGGNEISSGEGYNKFDNEYQSILDENS